MEAGDASADWSLHHCSSLRQLTLSKSLVSSWERSMSGKSVSKRSEHTSSSPYWRRKKRGREREKGHVSQTSRLKQNSQAALCLFFWDATKVHESLCTTWTQKKKLEVLITAGRILSEKWTSLHASLVSVALLSCAITKEMKFSLKHGKRVPSAKVCRSVQPLLELGGLAPLGPPFLKYVCCWSILWGTLDKSLHHLAYTVYYYTVHCQSHKELSSTAPHLSTATHYR